MFLSPYYFIKKTFIFTRYRLFLTKVGICPWKWIIENGIAIYLLCMQDNYEITAWYSADEKVMLKKILNVSFKGVISYKVTFRCFEMTFFFLE